jgi:hypothetical protein
MEIGDEEQHSSGRIPEVKSCFACIAAGKSPTLPIIARPAERGSGK